MTDKQTILIVAEDKEMVRTLEENLVELSNHYVIKTSYDGRSALEILKGEKPDLMLLDTQIPVVSGLQLLAELYNKGIWLPVILITDSRLNEKNSQPRDFGVVDLVKKPFIPEEVAVRIDEMMKTRERKDLIKNIGLPSILQLIEMEKRTGILTLEIDRENARIFFKEGKVMDLEVKGLSREQALEKLINSLYEDRELSIEYIDHRKDKKINMTLMEMVMEASRIKDEKKIPRGSVEPGIKDGKKPGPVDLSKLVEFLDSLKEVERYIVADTEGEVRASSPGVYEEEVLSSSLYLWVIGDRMKNDLDLGELANLTCHFKNRKRLIRKYNDLIIILELMGLTKFSVFKEKLNEHFERWDWK